MQYSTIEDFIVKELLHLLQWLHNASYTVVFFVCFSLSLSHDSIDSFRLHHCRVSSKVFLGFGDAYGLSWMILVSRTIVFVKTDHA